MGCAGAASDRAAVLVLGELRAAHPAIDVLRGEGYVTNNWSVPDGGGVPCPGAGPLRRRTACGGRRARKCPDASCGVSGLRDVLSLNRCIRCTAIHCTATWCIALQRGAMQGGRVGCNDATMQRSPVAGVPPAPAQVQGNEGVEEATHYGQAPALVAGVPPPHNPGRSEFSRQRMHVSAQLQGTTLAALLQP
jgi:hypothetical protein